MQKTIGLKVGPQVITTYRRLAYEPWYAIAEFVDNSTQSYFNNKMILDRQMKKDNDESLIVSVAYDRRQEILRIVDNAMGMSFTELEHALHVARPPENTSGRSKYGMGMKTAACWMGDKWSIKTKKLGEDQEHCVIVNVTKVANGDSDAVNHTMIKKPDDMHYTIVEISEMNRKFHGRTLGKIKDFLRSMYRIDLQDQILKLIWQDEELRWENVDPLLRLDPRGNRYKRTFDFDIGGRAVRGWVGILRNGSRAKAGFSILQSNRMVKGYPDAWRPSTLYGQLQGSNDLVNQRLVGEIHLDDFDVSHTKDSILWQGEQEAEVEEKLDECCGEYKELAKKLRKGDEDERGPRELDVSVALDELKKELNSPEMVDQINIQVIPPPEIISETNERIVKSVIENNPPQHQGYIQSNPEIAWKVHLDKGSPNDQYAYGDSANPNEITVIVNVEHPYWRTQLMGTRSILDYLRHCVYDSLAEWQARVKNSKIDPGTVKLLKDRLLRVPFQIEQDES